MVRCNEWCLAFVTTVFTTQHVAWVQNHKHWTLTSFPVSWSSILPFWYQNSCLVHEHMFLFQVLSYVSLSSFSTSQTWYPGQMSPPSGIIFWLSYATCSELPNKVNSNYLPNNPRRHVEVLNEIYTCNKKEEMTIDNLIEYRNFGFLHSEVLGQPSTLPKLIIYFQWSFDSRTAHIWRNSPMSWECDSSGRAHV
jgi:hypothetical protein